MRAVLVVLVLAAIANSSVLLNSMLAALGVPTNDQKRDSSQTVEKRKIYRSTQALIESFGYPVENHTVTTEDCYILRMYRIPKPGGRPVFILHGMFDSSASWSVPGPRRALSLLLWDAGYDVWLGNARGNMEARQSCKYDPDRDAAFWDFSFHEIGVYDLPASIDYILAHTNQSDLHYVGFSQSTTTFFVMASEVPGSMSKIRTANLLAPVVYTRDARSLIMRIHLLYSDIWPIAKATGAPWLLEYLPNSPATIALGQTFCKAGDLTQDLCYKFFFLLVGTNWAQADRDLLAQLIINVPAGISLKQLVHFRQLQKAYVFRQFDYGPDANMARYGSPLPPEYDLSRVTCNTTLVYALNDPIAVESNVLRIQRNIANSTAIQIADPLFNHLDFSAAKDVKSLLNDGIVARIRSYDGL